LKVNYSTYVQSFYNKEFFQIKVVSSLEEFICATANNLRDKKEASKFAYILPYF